MRKIPFFIIGFMLISTMFAGCLEESGTERNKEEYTPPQIFIVSPVRGETVSGVVEVSVVVSPVRTGQVITYSVDESSLESSQSLSYLWDTTTVENGEHLIEVTVQDTGPDVPEGVAPSVASVRVNVYNSPQPSPEPNTPPTVEISTPAGAIDGVYRGPILLTGRAVDAESELRSVEMRVNGGSWFDVQVRNGEWRKVLLLGAFSGEINVEVRAFDEQDYSAIQSITLPCDNLPPEISFISPESGETISGTIEITVDVSDDHNISFVSFSLDGAEMQNSSAHRFMLDTTMLSSGQHTLRVGSADMLGNYASKEIEVTVHNNHPPVAVISLPETGAEFDENEVVHFDAEGSSDPDGDSLFYLWESSLDGILSHEATFDTRLSVGEHTITLKVSDPDGEESIASVSVSVKAHENEAPEIYIVSPENQSAHRGIVRLEGNALDPDGTLTNLSLKVDDGDWQNISQAEDWSFELDTRLLKDGNHTIVVRAEDDEGASASDSIEIFTDNSPPRLTDIIIHPSSIFFRQNVTVEAVLYDISDIAYTNFDFDGKSIHNSTDTVVSIDTTAYPDGEYYLVINASDTLGNVLSDFSANNSLTVVVDNTPPEVGIEGLVSGDYVHGLTEITAEASDRNGIEYVAFFIDGKEVQNSSAGRFSWDTTQYSEGNHTVEVRASDMAGNTNATSISVMVDNTPPEVRIDSPAEGETVDGTFYINVTASDPGIHPSGMGVTIFYLGLTYLGADKDAPYQMEVNASGFNDGDYTIQVIGEDRAGNRRPVQVNITIRDTTGAIISDPHTNYLAPYPVNGVRHIIIHDYQGIPYLSPLVKQNVTPSVDWNSNDPSHELNITYTSVGRFSGNIALSYYTKPDYAVVVDGYRHALLMAPVAWMLNAPLIIYDSRYTDEALWRLETIYANQIIVMGNTPYNDKGVTVVEESELLHFALTTAGLQGIGLHYIALTNPDDVSGSADVPHLSAFAAAFAIEHDGIVLPVPANPNQIETIAHNAYTAFNNSGMTEYFLALIGDARSVPFFNGNVGGHSAPSDNRYADIDGDLSTVEVPTGRIISRTLSDLSYYLDRIVHYTDYLAVDRTYPPTTPVMGPFWNNNALIYMGWATEHLAWQTSYRHWQVFISSLFSTQDDTPQAHGGGGTTLLMEDFARANFIAMNADHGSPDSTMTFSSSDLLDMHPGVLFAVSCSLGRIDGVNIQTSMTYTVLEKGMNVYLGSTRTTYGAVGVTAEAADGLSLYFWQNLVTDETTGEAMMHAKQDLKHYGTMPINDYVCWEYVHYGDPAFNPYEPVNEGS